MQWSSGLAIPSELYSCAILCLIYMNNYQHLNYELIGFLR